MSKAVLSASPEGRAAITGLFDREAPILVEVRFPGCGTSPDWHLCEEEEQFNDVLDRLGAGAEVRLVSVWQIKTLPGELIVRK